MASLSASTWPGFTGGRGAEPDDLGMSITYPWVLKCWFQSIGAQYSFDCLGLGLTKAGLSDFVRPMGYGSRCWLALQIDFSLIKGGGPNTMRKRHWVVVDPHRQPCVRRGDGRLVPLSSIADQFYTISSGEMAIFVHDVAIDQWRMELKVVTWGQENYSINMSALADLPARFYGGYAFPRQH